MGSTKELELQNVLNYIEVGKETQSALRFHVQCPVCDEYMLDQIGLCESGHSFCYNCRQILTCCPMCNQGFNNERNLNLESIALLLSYPCRYGGCKEVRSALTIRSHEKMCEFGPIRCILNVPNCSGYPWEEDFTLARYHIDKEHSSNVGRWTRLNFRHIYVNVCFYKEKPFVVFFKYVPKYIYFSAMFIGNEKEVHKYVVKLKFSDETNKGFALSVRAPCNYLCKLSNIFDKNKHKIVFLASEMKRFIDKKGFYICEAKIKKA